MQELSEFDMGILLAWFRHNMGFDLRSRLMDELPVQYNRMVQREVMSVLSSDTVADLKAKAEATRPVDITNVRAYAKDLLGRHNPNKIEVIKMVRYMTGWGLLESKKLADDLVVEIENERRQAEKGVSW